MFHRIAACCAFVLLTTAGCGGMSSMMGQSSQADRDQATWEADVKAEHDKCVKVLRGKEKELEVGAAALHAKQVASEDEVTTTAKEISQLIEGVLASIRSACQRENDAKQGTPLHEIYATYRTPILERAQAFDASVRAGYRKLLLDLVKKAVAITAPMAARAIFWMMYEDEPTTENEELSALAKQIGAQFDKVLLERYRSNGGYAHHGAGESVQGCVFSGAPFPENLDDVEPIFNSHIDGHIVYVVCRLPQPARSYQAGIDPKLGIQLISENAARTVHVAEVFDLGAPTQVGDSMLVRGAFALPPKNGRFPNYVRHWFDVRVFVGYSTQLPGGGLERHTLIPSQASFSWHK